MQHNNSISLFSAENEEFPVKSEYLMEWKSFRELHKRSKSGEIRLSAIPSDLLRKVVQYLEYAYTWKDVVDQDIPDFEVDRENCLDLLFISDYLGLNEDTCDVDSVLKGLPFKAKRTV